MQVYVTDLHPHYLVIVDGEVYDEMTVRAGHRPLTHREKHDIAQGYLTALRGSDTIE